jgi:phosphonatase-like hydrolase
MEPIRPALAVFDLVGTTIAATDEVAEALRGACLADGLDPPPEAIASIRGRRKSEAIPELLRAVDPAGHDAFRRAARIGEGFRERLRARYRERPVREIPGASEAMGWLSGRGVKVALATGLERDLVPTLIDQLGWRRALFSAVVCGDEVALGRPAPDLIRTAMNRSGVEDPALVAAIGDTSADLEAAANAGVGIAIGVLSGAGRREALARLPHTVLLDSVADLPRWWQGRY